MKKLLLSAAALLMTLGIAQSSFAASADVYIQITVTAGSVTITRTSAGTVDYGQFVVGTSTVLATPATFQNDGDTIADWSVESPLVFTANWTAQTDAPAPIAVVDQVRLSALFTGALPALGDFAANDTISAATVACTADAYAITADAVGVKGYDVPNGGASRDLYFRLDTPAAGSQDLNVQLTGTVTVTAAVGI